MAELPRAQHFVLCQLCTSNVQFYCTPCKIRLCEGCVGHHLQTNTPEGHRFIHYHKRRNKTLTDPDVLSTVTCENINQLDLTISASGHIYTCSTVTRRIGKYDVNGVNYAAVLADGWPRRLASFENVIVFTERNNNVIKKITDDGQTMTMFSTGEWRAQGVAFSASGDILLTLRNVYLGKVVRYSMDGQTLQTIEVHNNVRIYKNPFYVVENANGDICTTDLFLCTVVVVDSSGNLKFQYAGTTPEVENSFEPHGISTDSQCNIIVADWISRKLHIVSESGIFRRYIIYDHQDPPSGVCIDRNDILYVLGYNSQKLKIIKYLT